MENQKQDKASSQKPDFKSGSRLRVGKVQAPHNARQKTVPSIKQIKYKNVVFLNIYLFLNKIQITIS